MSGKYIPKALRERVAAQAEYRCGYCQTQEEVVGMALEIDHLIPRAQQGATDEVNLWLACSTCNDTKNDRISATDPLTGEAVALFNPRQQAWREHFNWSAEGDRIIGMSGTGRATVAALNLNRFHLVRSRRIWVKAGVHPPKD